MSIFHINPRVMGEVYVVYSVPVHLNKKLLQLYPISTSTAHCAVVQQKDISAKCKPRTGFQKCWLFPFMFHAVLTQETINSLQVPEILLASQMGMLCIGNT